MWCVRESYYVGKSLVSVSYAGIFHDESCALQCAYFRRCVLNFHWTVEVCELSISSAHLVRNEKKSGRASFVNGVVNR